MLWSARKLISNLIWLLGAPHVVVRVDTRWSAYSKIRMGKAAPRARLGKNSTRNLSHPELSVLTNILRTDLNGKDQISLGLGVHWTSNTSPNGVRLWRVMETQRPQGGRAAPHSFALRRPPSRPLPPARGGWRCGRGGRAVMAEPGWGERRARAVGGR